MIEAKDMWHIYTTNDDDDVEDKSWTWRMQSIGKEYLKTRGHEWLRLNFIKGFKVEQKTDEETST